MMGAPPRHRGACLNRANLNAEAQRFAEKKAEVSRGVFCISLCAPPRLCVFAFRIFLSQFLAHYKLRIAFRGRAAADEALDAARKITPRPQDSPLACLADQANIRANAHDLPLPAAARMRLAHFDHIPHIEGRRDFNHRDGYR